MSMSDRSTSTSLMHYLLLFSHLSLAIAQCSTFSASGPIYTSNAAAVAISEGATCQSSLGCNFGDIPNIPDSNATYIEVQVGGILQAHYVAQSEGYVASASAASSLFSLISKTVPNLNPQATITSNITTGVSFELAQNQSAYIGFEPAQHCVNGTVSGCSGSSYPSDGTILSACTPFTEAGCQTSGKKAYDCLVGTLTAINVTQEQATNISCPVCTSSAASDRPAGKSMLGMSAFAAVIALAVGTVVF